MNATVQEAVKATLPATAEGFAAVLIEVSQKDPKNAGKYAKVGELYIHVPLVSSLIAEAIQAKDDKGADLFDDDGLPVYTEDKFNWLQGAILASVKASARNKLISKTAQVREGSAIATDWATLTAEGGGTGNPAALIAIRELKTKFANWAKASGKSEKAQQLLTTLFNSKTALEVQNEDNKTKMTAYLTQFAESLGDAINAYEEKYLNTLLEIADKATEADDF